jgi:hypothetical protein
MRHTDLSSKWEQKKRFQISKNVLDGKLELCEKWAKPSLSMDKFCDRNVYTEGRGKLDDALLSTEHSVSFNNAVPEFGARAML